MSKKIFFLYVIVIIIFIVFVGCSAIDEENVAEAIVLTIEINPSVKLSLDSDQMVVAFKTLNADAETLILNDIVGKDAVLAVEMIISKAMNAGFITEEDLEEDFVMITTVPMNDNSKEVDNLGQRIKEYIHESDEMKSVNIAMIKATKVELREAEGKKIPIGLYIIKGSITTEGNTISVKEYFSKEENIEKFKQKGEVIEKNQEKRIEQVNRYLDRVESQGYDVSSFRSRLNQEDVNVKSLTKEIRKTIKIEKKSNKNPSNEGNGKSKSKGN
jgi:hypothetical protein